MKTKKQFFISLFVIALTGNLFGQTTKILHPIQDAMVLSAKPKTNYQSSPYFMAEARLGRTLVKYRSFIQFDLSDIEDGAVIESATLELSGIFHSYNGNNPTQNQCYLQRNISPWSHANITWNNMPASTEYGRSLLPASTSSNQNYSIDVTDIVAGWKEGLYPNYGCVLKLVTEADYAKLQFASNDNIISSKRPKLIVTYHLPNIVNGKENNFKIGNVAWGKHCQSFDYDAEVPNIITETEVSDYNSSVYNVFSSDGFNIIRTYEPGTGRYIAEGRPYGHNKDDFKNIIRLIENNNLQLMTYSDFSLKVKPDGTYEHQFTMDDIDLYDTYYLNYNEVYNEVYNNDDFKDIIWGHNITGETHSHAYLDFNARPMAWCSRTSEGWPACEALWTQSIEDVEPQLIDDAFEYFESIKLPQHKLINGPGAHNNLIYNPVGKTDFYYSRYIVPDYDEDEVDELEHIADVCYDAGYMPANFHLYFSENHEGREKYRYLWNFENIDYEKQFYSDVHAEFDVTWYDPATPQSSDDWSPANERQTSSSTHPDRNNFNNLWFKTYTSIIHGVQGVWFYYVLGMYSDSGNDPANWTKLDGGNDIDRFSLEIFPQDYQDLLRHLVRELRLLVNFNLLSSDPNTIVYTKTKESDHNGILLPCSEYLHETVTDLYWRDVEELVEDYHENDPENHPLSWEDWKEAYPNNTNNTDERFGLRYTVRTNGDEVIMIVSNPNPFLLPDVELNFSNVANPIIRNSNSVDILFRESDPNAYFAEDNYKTSRYAAITLAESDFDDGSIYKKNLPLDDDNTLDMSFGPFDVHVLRFIPEDPNVVSGYHNGWEKIWSNHGSGKIRTSWTIHDYDNFLAGDFDGDGAEELLCTQHNESDNSWALMKKYYNGDWKWYWDNGGNDRIDWWYLDHNTCFFVGNFDGDVNGQDELLIISRKDNGTNNWACLYQFDPVQKVWHKLWGNDNGTGVSNGRIGWWHINAADDYLVGDFDNDGKDDLLSIGKFNIPNNFAQLHNFNGTDWTNLYSNDIHEELGMIGSWEIDHLDIFKSGKFKGQDYCDYLLCFEGEGPSNRMLKYNPDDNVWDNTSYYTNSGTFGGWGASPLNPTDEVLIGEIDDKDDKDEVLFIQNKPNAKWAVSFDLNSAEDGWNWNWEGSPNSGHYPYFDDWPINPSGGSNTDYMLIKANKTDPEYLMAFRSFGPNDQYLTSMYKSITNTQKSATVNVGGENTEHNAHAKEPAKEAIELYPNPATSDLTVKLFNVNEVNSIKVLNTNGKEENVQLNNINQATININLSGLSKGLYFVHIVTGSSVITEKLILK